MNQQVNKLIMNASDEMLAGGRYPEDPEEERQFRKERLAAALRIFGKFGFDEGVAGHITVRDPIDSETFWVNPMGRSFKQMCVSDLIRVDHDGQIVEGQGLLNGAAFTIHGHIHRARPEVTAAYAHSVYGKAWSSLGRLLDPLTQDACAFLKIMPCWMTTPGWVVDMAEGNVSLGHWETARPSSCRTTAI